MLIGRLLEWKMLGWKYMAQQLDCTTCIASTQNSEIHGIDFGQHSTFNKVDYWARKCKCGYINIWGLDWITSDSHDSSNQRPCEIPTLSSISGSAMIVWLKISHISSQHYSTGIFSNVYSSIGDITHFKRSSILNRCAMKNGKVVQYTATWTWAIGGWICVIRLLPGQWLSQSFVHPTNLTWHIFQAISISGHCTSQLERYEKISAGHLPNMPWLLLGWFHIPQMVRKILTRYGIL